jgi:hypothetical protein
MNVEKVISDFLSEDTKKLKDRLANANRILSKDPTHMQAKHLRSAIDNELARRKISSRKKVGRLWWEPHDPDAAEFFAYPEIGSTTPVAAIFKCATHTAIRKEVYSVRIGDQVLDGQFSEVAVARRIGSEAWGKCHKP